MALRTAILRWRRPCRRLIVPQVLPRPGAPVGGQGPVSLERSAPRVLRAHVRIRENPVVSGDECQPVPSCRRNEDAIRGVPLKRPRERIGLHGHLLARGDGLRGRSAIDSTTHSASGMDSRISAAATRRAISRVEIQHTAFSCSAPIKSRFVRDPSRPGCSCVQIHTWVSSSTLPQHVPVAGRVDLDEVAADGHPPLEASEGAFARRAARRAGRRPAAFRAA